jgi:hypothetical protein
MGFNMGRFFSTEGSLLLRLCIVVSFELSMVDRPLIEHNLLGFNWSYSLASSNYPIFCLSWLPWIINLISNWLQILLYHSYLFMYTDSSTTPCPCSCFTLTLNALPRKRGGSTTADILLSFNLTENGRSKGSEYPHTR